MSKTAWAWVISIAGVGLEIFIAVSDVIFDIEWEKGKLLFGGRR